MNSIYRQGKNSGMALFVMLAAVTLLAGTALPAQAQSYTPLFNYDTGQQWFAGPSGQLALGRDGNFYGMTFTGDILYNVTPEGNPTVLWVAPDQFEWGVQCNFGLTLGPDGLLYGPCMDIDQEWSYGSGAIFKYDPTQVPTQNGFTVLYEFPVYGCSVQPNALTLNTDGNFYGTTQGANCGTAGYGTFFKITPSGTLTTLHTFQGDPADAAYPSAVTLGNDGNFYGTSPAGGAYNSGTIFKITSKGKLTLLYSFESSGTTPYEPGAPLTQGTNGAWYGTTFLGGTYNYGTIFELKGKTLTVLHNFDQSVDTAYPNFPLTLGTDGNFYATSEATAFGGYAPESIFEITTAKKPVYSTLFSWTTWGGPGCSAQLTNGCLPSSPLAPHPNGMFYGTTNQGGSVDAGEFYSFSMGFKPYIILQFPRGTIGTSIGIFGTGLTGTTAVSFDGVDATSFTVDSDTYLTAVIPTGAKTGYVTVTTPTASLTSAIKLTVVK